MPSPRTRPALPPMRSPRVEPEPSPSPAPLAPVERLYGMRTVEAIFRVRPHDVVRILYGANVSRSLAGVLREASTRRIAFREVSDEELDRAAGATHHEGVVVSVRLRETPTFARWITQSSLAGPVLALDRVGNPHNLGAVLRTAAYFGLPTLLLDGSDAQARLTPAAARISEGGCEYVDRVVAEEGLAEALRGLRARGFTVVGTDARAEHRLHELRDVRRSVIVLGNERSGMTPAVRAACDGVVGIPGTGDVDSLNVSVTAGIAIAAMARAI